MVKEVMKDLLSEKGVKERYSKGCIIYSRGDKREGLYYLDQGNVQMSLINNEGSEKVVVILRPGDIFGEVSLFNGDNCFCTAIALGKVEVFWLETEKLLNCAKTHPDIYWFLLNSMSKKIRMIQLQLENQICFNSKEKIARTLLALASNNEIITSQEDLAKIVNLSRVTVNKVLNEFKQQKALRILRSKTIITNVTKLRSYAQMEM